MKYTIDGQGGYREIDTTDNLHRVDANYFESAARQLDLPAGDYQAEWHESNGTSHIVDFSVKPKSTKQKKGGKFIIKRKDTGRYLGELFIWRPWKVDAKKMTKKEAEEFISHFEEEADFELIEEAEVLTRDDIFGCEYPITSI